MIRQTDGHKDGRMDGRTHPFTHTPTHPCTHTPIHPCTHAPTHPYTHARAHNCKEIDQSVLGKLHSELLKVLGDVNLVLQLLPRFAIIKGQIVYSGDDPHGATSAKDKLFSRFCSK